MPTDRLVFEYWDVQELVLFGMAAGMGLAGVLFPLVVQESIADQFLMSCMLMSVAAVCIEDHIEEGRLRAGRELRLAKE